MDSKETRLDSLKRVAERLRRIQDDPFAKGLADRIEEQLIVRNDGSATTESTEPTPIKQPD